MPEPIRFDFLMQPMIGLVLSTSSQSQRCSTFRGNLLQGSDRRNVIRFVKAELVLAVTRPTRCFPNEAARLHNETLYISFH